MLHLKSQSGPLVVLSKRECDVLRHLSNGLANKAIAAHLGIAESTVKGYVGELTAELDMTRLQLTTWAVAHPGVISGEAVDPTYRPPFGRAA